MGIWREMDLAGIVRKYRLQHHDVVRVSAKTCPCRSLVEDFSRQASGSLPGYTYKIRTWMATIAGLLRKNFDSKWGISAIARIKSPTAAGAFRGGSED